MCDDISHIVLGPGIERERELNRFNRSAVNRLVDQVRKEIEAMSKTVRCKFLCNRVGESVSTRSEQVDDGEGGKKWESTKESLYDVEMTPVYSDVEGSENKKFWRWTPSGSFKMGAIVNGMFKPGQEYYIDITPAEE